MQKYGKSNTQNEIFFEVFWRGLVFNGMEMAFLYRLKPLAQNNLLRRTQASGNGTKEMVWNAQARDEGGRDGIAGTERRGGRFLWLQRCYLFSAALSKRPLAVSSDTGQVFYGSNGVNGAGWAVWGLWAEWAYVAD